MEVTHDLPGVGRNLQDHVSFGVTFSINQSDTNTLDYISLKDYMVSRNGPLSSRDLMVVTAKIASPYSNGKADIQYYFFSSLPQCSKTGIPGTLNSDGPRILTIRPVMLRPKSRGFIKLNSSNPFEYPMIFGNQLQDSRDFDIILHGAKFAVALGKSKALEKYNTTLAQEVAEGCEDFEYGSDDFWKCSIKATYDNDNHEAGTCKMGPANDPMAVVDARLKVHGIQGLRVIDSSIMPNVVSGNTHAPTMMIGEMGSQFVKDDWEGVTG